MFKLVSSTNPMKKMFSEIPNFLESSKNFVLSPLPTITKIASISSKTCLKAA